ncbi:MAG: DUF2785 domain-containing protein [Nocardioides sp.]
MPSRVNWKAVHGDDFRVPDHVPLIDLTAELTAMLGSIDPQLRDGVASRTLSTWISRGIYDDLLPGLGDGMTAGLSEGLGRRDDDSVFRRSSSALIVRSCIERDNQRPLVSGGKVLDWGDRVATWLLREVDIRGFVPGRGWAHAVAHGADTIGTLAGSPHLGAAELAVLLDVIGERVCLPVEHLFVNGEPDRLAAAAVALLRRERVPFDVVEGWLAHLLSTRPVTTDLHRDPYLGRGNLEAFVRGLYLQLALGPEPPATRADLVLLLVDALRELNPSLRRG